MSVTILSGYLHIATLLAIQFVYKCLFISNRNMYAIKFKIVYKTLNTVYY